MNIFQSNVLFSQYLSGLSSKSGQRQSLQIWWFLHLWFKVTRKQVFMRFRMITTNTFFYFPSTKIKREILYKKWYEWLCIYLYENYFSSWTIIRWRLWIRIVSRCRLLWKYDTIKKIEYNQIIPYNFYIKSLESRLTLSSNMGTGLLLCLYNIVDPSRFVIPRPSSSFRLCSIFQK